MSDLTICGIALAAFKDAPTPEELGRIVARWDNEKQAAFLCFLMEQIKFTYPVARDVFQLQYIADELRKDQCEFGRDFICDVADMIRYDPSGAPTASP